MTRMLTVFFLSLLVATAVADERKVHTDRAGAALLPLPKEEGAFHFLIFGDRTGGPIEGLDVLRQAVKDTNLLGPDLVMTVGDLVPGYCPREPWLAQMREYKGIMKDLDMPWFPAPGNHDMYWRGSAPPPGEHEADYEANFGPLWYWFPHKNAAFVVLFTDEGDPATGRKGYGRPELHRFSDRQLAWLAKTLEETKAYDHVMLFMHHPRWIEDFYPGTNWPKVHALLKAAGNVSAVFAGHIHRQRYEGLIDGIEYMTLSTTGGSIPMDAPGTGFLHHMNLVTVRPDRITIATIPVGVLLDPKEMTPARLAEVDNARKLPAALASEPIDVMADGSATGDLAYRITNPTSRPLSLTASCRAVADDWRIGAGHRHFRLEPGASEEVAFPVSRGGDGFAGEFSIPEVVLEVQYLAEARRIALGEQTKAAVVRPAAMPESVLAAKENRALRLDGKSCVTVPASGFHVPDGPFTVEAWAAPARDRLSGVVVANFDFGIFLQGGVPYFGFDIGKTSVYVSGRPEHALAGGRWHHLAAVFDGKTARLFVNGAPVGSAAAAGSQPRSGVDLHVGVQSDENGSRSMFFRGMIDEVRVSKGARYGEEGFTPARRAAVDEDTIVYLPLDAHVGPFTPDRSESAAHGCRTGSVEYVPVAADGDGGSGN